MYALILSGTANTLVNTDRVIRMLLIHDIVEIYAGDHPIHEPMDRETQMELERSAAERLFGLLPEQGETLLELWREFEAGASDDAAFAKSIDRMQPLMHNIATNGGTWIEANLSKSQVAERYGPTISAGSAALWREAEKLIETHFSQKVM